MSDLDEARFFDWCFDRRSVSGGCIVFGSGEQRAQGRRQLGPTRWTIRSPIPLVGANAIGDAGCQGNGVAACFTVDPRLRAGTHALDEVLQLRRELVALVAIEMEDLEVPSQHLGLEHGQDRGFELAWAQSLAAELLGGLDEF